MSSHMPNLRVIPQWFLNVAVVWAPRCLWGVLQRPCPWKPPLFIFFHHSYTLQRLTTYTSHSALQQRPLTATPLEVVLTHLWFHFSLMARDSGSMVATISQAQCHSNRANHGLNSHDAQLGQLGEQFSMPTRVTKRSFAPEEGIELEINTHAPAPKKRHTKVLSI